VTLELRIPEFTFSRSGSSIEKKPSFVREKPLELKRKEQPKISEAQRFLKVYRAAIH
jgi:hypothetical protein